MNAYRMIDDEPLKVEATPDNDYLFDDYGPIDYTLGKTRYIMEDDGSYNDDFGPHYVSPFTGFVDNIDAI